MEEGSCPGYSMYCIGYRCNVFLQILTWRLIGSLSSILATNTLTLVFIFGVSFTQIASLTGYFLLGVGCSAWLFSATARVYGKRHCYVIGSLFLVGGSIWGAVGSSFSSPSL